MEFIKKILEVKLNESHSQSIQIKNGITSIIPTPLLNLISAEDLEIWVCGRPTVDFDLLRRHTRFAGELNQNSDRVKYLWEALSELSE